MKSKRAEEFINNSSELIDGLEWMIDTSTARRAVELAEQDAEEKIEALKARAVEACCFACTQSGAGCDHRLRTDDYYLCDILNNFIQKLNER
jgi:hypothetical protein